MTVREDKFWRTVVVSVGVFISLLGFSLMAQAQAPSDYEAKRGLVYFKMGGNSHIASSPLDSNISFGFGGGYELFKKKDVAFSVEPGLLMNWPKNEDILLDGYRLRLSTKTMLLDLNGTVVVPKGHFFNLYLSGGIGLLRNSANITDGYQGYSLGGDNHLTKNVGGGIRFFLKEKFFVGGEAKNYWTKDNNFKVYSGTVGLVF